MAPALSSAWAARGEILSRDRNQSHLSQSGVYLQLQQLCQLSIQLAHSPLCDMHGVLASPTCDRGVGPMFLSGIQDPK